MARIKSPRDTARFFLLFGAIWTIAGTGSLISSMRNIVRAQRFERSAESVQAVVTGKSVEAASRTGKSRSSYVVAYRFFTPAGRTASGAATVDVHEWERLQPGRTIAVEFLPESPEENRLAGSGRIGNEIVGVVLGGVLAPVGAGLVIWSIRKLRRLRAETAQSG